MDMSLIEACGFRTIDDAIDYVKAEHGEEFARDGVITIYVYKIVKHDKA